MVLAHQRFAAVVGHEEAPKAATQAMLPAPSGEVLTPRQERQVCVAAVFRRGHQPRTVRTRRSYTVGNPRTRFLRPSPLSTHRISTRSQSPSDRGRVSADIERSWHATCCRRLEQWLQWDGKSESGAVVLRPTLSQTRGVHSYTCHKRRSCTFCTRVFRPLRIRARTCRSGN